MAMAKRDDTDYADAGLASKRATNDLISYLVVRFIVVLFAVMVLEQLVVWGEGLLLSLPSAFGSNGEGEPVNTLLAVVARLLGILAAVGRGEYVKAYGPARTSLDALLTLTMLLMLVLPPFLGALGFSRMTVRRIRALQEQRERELEQIDRQRSQFITDIAHDLRTPLMAISGMAHAIGDGVVRDDETRAEYVQAIGEKADKMSGLVSSVFDYTKLGSAAFSIDRERIDLPQLLLREAAAAYPDVEGAGMTFSVEVSEDPCPVFADPTQLGRVVSNLLVNAVRHNSAGTEIALLLVRRAGVAYVIVADSGVAIEGNPAELFQPFSRGDAARSDTGGSGLGLSICKRIADLHGYNLSLVQPYGRFSKAFVLRCDVL